MEFLDDVVAYKDHHPQSAFAWEYGRDFEASIYLALAAHYRQAVAVLRFALDNARLQEYFECHDGYEEWQLGRLFVPSGLRLIDAVFTREYRINAQLKKLSTALSHFVHIKNATIATGLNDIAFDGEHFDVWHEHYVQTCECIVLVTHAYRSLYREGLRPRWELLEATTDLREEGLSDLVWQKSGDDGIHQSV